MWITGIGTISALGIMEEEYLQNLYKGVDKSSSIQHAEYQHLKCKNAVTISEELGTPTKWRKYGKGVQLALLAAQHALKDARLDNKDYIDNAGICLGSMLGQVPDFQKNYYQSLQNNSELNPEQILQLSMGSLSDLLAYEFNISGIRSVASMACVSGVVAIGTAFQWIQLGRADVVICGGVETFSLLGHQIMSNLGIVSPDKTKPFDEKSNGFLLGEGAGILVLESEGYKKRGIIPYCEIKGYGIACDGIDMSLPDKNGIGLQKAMSKAFCEANETTEDISFVNSHGVGTKASDEAEIKALRKIFGSYLSRVPIYSIKGSVGHTSGASGAINLISAVHSLHYQCVPPTVNFNSNKKWDDLTITNEAIKLNEAKCCISNTIGFGGSNTSILLRRSNIERESSNNRNGFFVRD